MVTTLLKSTLREIRQSLGRYLAILAIIGLGVGFFAGLRMAQPSMIATGISYLDEHDFFDFRLMSTLGFTQEDVDAFEALDGIETAHGSVYTEFLWQKAADEEVVLISHMLTDSLNTPSLTAGRLPEAANECIGDALYFTEADLGTTIKVSVHNEEDTLELLSYEEYTLVGLANSPLYLNFERGTASIGSGSISAFVLIPEAGFNTEAYFELYLHLKDREETYSEEYQAQLDDWKPRVESLLEERAKLRYDTLYGDAMNEIRDGEQELADGWAEYRAERADAEQELAEAYQELLDAEQEYADGLADYEQGKLDYADGEKELVDAEQKLQDGWTSYEEGKAEAERQLADARETLEQGEQDYADGLTEWESGQAEIDDGRTQLDSARQQLAETEQQLHSVKAQLDNAKLELDQGEAGYQQAHTLYQNGQILAQAFGAADAPALLIMTEANPQMAAMVDAALTEQGSSLAQFRAGWTAAEQQLGAPLTQETLDAMRTQLDQAKIQYDTGLAEYETGLAQYRDGLAQLKASETELAAGQQELDAAKAQLDRAREELDDGWDEYSREEARVQQELADAYQELLDGEAELNEGKAELAEAKEELDRIPAELADARQELDDGWNEYEDGLAEAEEEFANAEQDLQEGEQEIADAYLELSDLKEPDTYTLTRNENVGYANFDKDTSIVAAISVVFPVFFFLVAALVCMTTMKRMVDEQRTQIGVLKAIGYSRSQIIGKYLFYSGSAAVIGSILGYALGSWGLPEVIWAIYDIMYGFAPLEFVFDPVLAVISFVAALLCSMGATYLSCRMELTRAAAELIRPKTPKAGKRVFLEYITPLWKRMSFLHKVSIRNVLRYRSRLIMMILGIGGCTALLVTGFGIRDSISSIVDDQYSQITVYDYAVNFQEPQTQEQADRFLLDHGWEQDAGLLVHSGSTDVVSDTATKSVYLVVPAAGRLDGFISLHSGDRAIPFPNAGEAVLNTGLAEDLAVHVGDTIRLRDTDLGTIEVTVSDICDNYVFNYVYVSPETYQQQLGITPEFKTMYVLAHSNANPYEEGVSLADGEGISSVSVNESFRERVNSMLSRLDILVVVIVLCAAALAFIVLYNLTNINITERVREIATIKVLGFQQGEVASYVFREIIILSVVASLVGLLLGKALHLFVMAQIQIDGMFFPVQITWISYLISVVLTLLFTTLIAFSMGPRLKRIDMAESLKSIE